MKLNEDVLKPREPKPWQKVENMIIGEDGKPTIRQPVVDTRNVNVSKNAVYLQDHIHNTT